MCELKVHTGARADEVVQDVVYAQVEPDHVLLKNVLGAVNRIPDSLIVTIDIAKESLFLRQSPIVPSFLRFLEACEQAESDENYRLAEKAWNDLKADGDRLVRALWRKHGRAS